MTMLSGCFARTMASLELMTEVPLNGSGGSSCFCSRWLRGCWQPSRSLLGAICGSDFDVIAIYDGAKASDVVDFVFLKEELNTAGEAF